MDFIFITTIVIVDITYLSDIAKTIIDNPAIVIEYDRFFTKALRDLGYLNFDEPFKSLVDQGTILGPVMLNIVFPNAGHLEKLTSAVLIGVLITLIGIGIIGVAGHMKAQTLSEEEKRKAVKDFNFPKGIIIALLAGFMSGCFNIGLEFGSGLHFAETNDMFKSLPATMLVTLGGFVTNAAYCLYQNAKNKSWSDYGKTNLYANNLFFCILAGLLWYSQFFGLSLGKGFLTESPTLTTFAFCILMALNVVFSNVWGIILKEWKGVSKKTLVVLIIGIIVLIISTFIPELLK